MQLAVDQRVIERGHAQHHGQRRRLGSRLPRQAGKHGSSSSSGQPEVFELSGPIALPLLLPLARVLFRRGRVTWKKILPARALSVLAVAACRIRSKHMRVWMPRVLA